MYGSLRSPSGEVRYLAERTEVGREGRWLVMVPQPASAHHATLSWDGGRWVLTQIGKNGTYVNRKRVEKGTETPLRAGDVLHFGDPTQNPWLLADDSPPAAVAHRLSDGHIVVLHDGTGVLPDEEAPEVEILRDPHGGWWASRGATAERIEPGRTYTVLDPAWEVHLPTHEPTQFVIGHIPMHEARLHLRHVGSNAFEAWLEHSGDRVNLPVSSDWEVAYALASNQCSGGRFTDDFVDNMVIAAETGRNEKSLAMNVTRIRRHLAAAGLQRATDAIEGIANRRRFRLEVVVHPE